MSVSYEEAYHYSYHQAAILFDEKCLNRGVPFCNNLYELFKQSAHALFIKNSLAFFILLRL